jgi:succinate dehydrogenase / fumarate reductase membrane anchor subunit
LKKALSGLRAWVIQRFTAVYMLLFLAFVLFHFAFYPPHSYEEWHGWIARPFVWTSAALFFVALLMHAWVGLRDVMMDYMKPVQLRISLLALLFLILAGLAIWALQILFSAQH